MFAVLVALGAVTFAAHGTLLAKAADVGPTLASVSARQAALAAAVPALRKEAANGPQLQPVAHQASRLFSALDGLAANTHVTVRSVAAQTPTQGAGYTSFPYTVTADGSVANLLLFLHRMSALPGGPTGVPLTGISLTENNQSNQAAAGASLSLTIVRYAAGTVDQAPAGTVGG